MITADATTVGSINVVTINDERLIKLLETAERDSGFHNQGDAEAAEDQGLIEIYGKGSRIKLTEKGRVTLKKLRSKQ